MDYELMVIIVMVTVMVIVICGRMLIRMLGMPKFGKGSKDYHFRLSSAVTGYLRQQRRAGLHSRTLKLHREVLDRFRKYVSSKHGLPAEVDLNFVDDLRLDGGDD